MAQEITQQQAAQNEELVRVTEEYEEALKALDADNQARQLTAAPQQVAGQDPDVPDFFFGDHFCIRGEG